MLQVRTVRPVLEVQIWLRGDISLWGLTDEDVSLLSAMNCDILTQGLIGLIEYSYHKAGCFSSGAGESVVKLFRHLTCSGRELLLFTFGVSAIPCCHPRNDVAASQPEALGGHRSTAVSPSVRFFHVGSLPQMTSYSGTCSITME
jgi:hypothetical protein